LGKIKFRPDDIVIVTISGRGDKDMAAYMNYMENHPTETPESR